MNLAFLLSKEHEYLPEKEVLSVLEAYSTVYSKKRIENLLLIQCTEMPPVDRLALTREVCKVVGEVEDLKELKEIGEPIKKSFRVRCKRLDREVDIDAESLEKKVGAILQRRTVQKVDLKNPGVEIKIYVHRSGFVVGRLIKKIDRSQYEKRRNQFRPFSSPVSLHPRLARALVNLAQVKPRESVLDPFCGTGGILIEAGLMGCRVYGMDIDPKMVEGCKRNLAHYGVNGHIVEGDVENIEDMFSEKFRAIITDLPYGRSSKVKGTPSEELIATLKKRCDRMVFVSNLPQIGSFESKYAVYVHKSLSRYVYVI